MARPKPPFFPLGLADLYAFRKLERPGDPRGFMLCADPMIIDSGNTVDWARSVYRMRYTRDYQDAYIESNVGYLSRDHYRLVLVPYDVGYKVAFFRLVLLDDMKKWLPSWVVQKVMNDWRYPHYKEGFMDYWDWGVDCEEPGIIYYRQNPRDTQFTKSTIGRYLSRKLGIAIDTDLQIAIDKMIAERFGSDSDFEIRSDVSTVYANIGSSCMTDNPEGCLSFYESNGVKALVYKEDARALLWTLKNGKKFIDRVYPNQGSILEHYRSYAKRHGMVMRDHNRHTGHGKPTDAELVVHIKYPDQPAPYMDTLVHMSADGHTLAACSCHCPDSKHYLDSTGGENPMDTDIERCAECEERIYDGEGFVQDGDIYCESCISEAPYCEHCERHFIGSRQDMVEVIVSAWVSESPYFGTRVMRATQWWCEDCALGLSVCEGCETLIAPSADTYCLNDDPDQVLCPYCYLKESFFQCGICKEEYAGIDPERTYQDEPVCPSCEAMILTCPVCEAETLELPGKAENGPCCASCGLDYQIEKVHKILIEEEEE